MKIDSGISSTYGLFGQSGQRNKQQPPLDLGESSVRQSSGGLEFSTTPPSISNTMWALQSGGNPSITPATDDEVAAKARHDALVADFSKRANMTAAEYIRSQVLERLGLTEDSLKGMSSDERAAVEKQISDEIKKQLTGNDDEGTDQKSGIPAI